MNVMRLVRKEVSALTAYQAKEIPARIKLDANESPYGLGRALKAARGIATNRYPDPEAKQIKRVIGRMYRVKPANLLQGNGSDELISSLIMTFGGPVLFPVPTFSMYGIIAQALGQRPVPVALDPSFDLDMPGMRTAITKHRPKLIFLSTPNNPTGNCFSAGRIRTIVERTNAVVVVDEAYQPFSRGKGFVPFLERYPNLVILRTVSKIGLAALRLGFLIASPDIVSQVNKVRLPFNVNSLSQAVAEEALADRAMLSTAVSRIVRERKKLFDALRRMPGAEPFPTDANFILFKVNDAKTVHQGLLRQGVLVRDVSDAVSGCLRVTVGRPGENAVFLAALRKTLSRPVQGGTR